MRPLLSRICRSGDTFGFTCDVARVKNVFLSFLLSSELTGESLTVFAEHTLFQTINAQSDVFT